MHAAIKYLLSIESKGIKLGFDRAKSLNKSCQYPDKNLKIVQVAGTNGKGSTCSMISNILVEEGYQVGLFTSPHLVNVNERIRINGEPINNDQIANFINLYKLDIEKISASFFETLTILAFWHFKNHNVDYAIMETGLGGRLDSVTICNPIMTVITSISMDHAEILGDSLEKIAMEKAGIIKQNTPCITIQQRKEVSQVIKSECLKKNANLIISDNYNQLSYTPSLPGDAQLQNAHLAEVTINQLIKNIKNNVIINGIEKTTWYGRNQVIQKNPLVIFDVAHNESGIASFIKYIELLRKQNNKRLVLSLQSRKNITSQVDLLLHIFDEIILCETNNKRTMKIDDLKLQFKNDKKITCIQSDYKAIQYGINKNEKGDLLAIIGTHYFGNSISKIFNISFNLL